MIVPGVTAYLKQLQRELRALNKTIQETKVAAQKENKEGRIALHMKLEHLRARQREVQQMLLRLGHDEDSQIFQI